MKNTAEQIAFWGAKARCNNPQKANYKNYGGRGIQFRFKSFQEFLSDVGLRPSREHTLDRINTNGHYEAGNLHWATKGEQAITRRTYAGKSSPFRGVGWHKNHKKWVARIKVKQKFIFLAYFDNEIDAAKCYDEFAKKYFGARAVLNF